MNAIQFHISSLSKTISDLIKGRYLLFFLPGLIVGILFWQLILFTSSIENSFDFLEHTPLIGSYLKSGVEGIFSIIIFLFNQIFIFFVLTLLSPFNTILSEKIDTAETGKKYPFDFSQLVLDVLRMVLVVVIILFLELFVFFIYWIFSSILRLGFLDSAAYFLISSFFYGFSFYDYSLERNKLGVGQSLKFAFSNIPLVTLSGVLFLLLYKIPFIGVVLAPVITTMVTTYVFIAHKKAVLKK